MKRNVLALLLLTAVLFSCQNVPPPAPEPTRVEVEGAETAVPTPARPEGITILAEGQIVAVNPELPLSFGVSGRLKTVTVQPGDRVQAGDLLAELETADLENQLVQAQTALSTAEIQLANA
ncbi:MAG: biotin/lipoyl-binding protein, partial [Anaerolineales bacterium]|nr:biotin/lipoyl-binding protein [Anaerolineales bacterium]